jgi:hypothetical protein
MNAFTKTMIVAGLIAMMGSTAWAYPQDGRGASAPVRHQATGAIDVNSTTAPVNSQPVVRADDGPPIAVEKVRRWRGYYRYPYSYGYGWRPYYYGGPYYYNYYGVPRAGYYDYGYGRGAVRVGPVQVWW